MKKFLLALALVSIAQCAFAFNSCYGLRITHRTIYPSDVLVSKVFCWRLRPYHQPSYDCYHTFPVPRFKCEADNVPTIEENNQEVITTD